MKRTSAMKHTFTVEDVYARARDTLEQCLLNGVMHMRTHVEVDPPLGCAASMRSSSLAKDYAWGIDLQLCAFLQEGWTQVPGGEVNVVQAPSAGRPGRRRAALRHRRPRADRRIFALAKDFDVDVDIHLDGGYTTRRYDDLAGLRPDRSNRLGRPRGDRPRQQVFVPAAGELEALGKRLAKSGVAVAVLPATDIFTSGRHMEHSVMRGLADANALVAQGANCSIATNNVLNPVHALRRLLARADREHVRERRAARHRAGSGGVLRAGERAAGAHPAQGRLRHRVGNPADLVVWNAKSPAEVIATVAQPLMGFKRGRRVFTRELPTLHRPLE